MKVKVVQSCLTLCNPMDYTVHGILQARMMDWVAFAFSRGVFPIQSSEPLPIPCLHDLYAAENDLGMVPRALGSWRI